ncbi:MAG: beta-galactosidase small subunit [Lachnospiraceae bacterium]|nr:beta-galactosidase small subunit [Lachnospiraceae bacterium]
MANTANKLRIIYGDVTLGVKGEGFHYIFSYARGGLESIKKNGKEWLYRVPRPTFWRATTDNDRGNGFPIRSNMWLGAGLFQKAVPTQVIVDGKEQGVPITPMNNQYSNQEYAGTVTIVFHHTIETKPNSNVTIRYTVEQDGSICVNMKYLGQKGLPGLPLLGMRFVMPTKATGFVYEGLSGETYPDRMDGGVPGIYQVEGLPVTPYLVPQDCGVHMDTKWVEVIRNRTRSNIDQGCEVFSLRFEQAADPFAFSCLPYTAEELEHATHHEELPPERFTVLLMLAKVRGLGGINSWGADVEAAYHISAEESYDFSFVIK